MLPDSSLTRIVTLPQANHFSFHFANANISLPWPLARQGNNLVWYFAPSGGFIQRIPSLRSNVWFLEVNGTHLKPESNSNSVDTFSLFYLVLILSALHGCCICYFKWSVTHHWRIFWNVSPSGAWQNRRCALVRVTAMCVSLSLLLSYVELLVERS